MITKEVFGQKAIASAQAQYRIAWAILGNKADCQDAMQEALLKAWAARHKLRDERYFNTWLIRILINECKTIRRKQAKHVLMPEAQQAVETRQPDTELRYAIDTLPEKLRLPLVMHYFEGYPVKDIAKALASPTGTVKNRLLEARKRLRAELEYDKEVWPHEAKFD
ncbi:MAG: sigma-70 family RNA polymerase sigma factor [Clostridia bacterium]|nr:sigma-70 family RNA polymerase sigma factor [Clostridia bacterium]